MQADDPGTRKVQCRPFLLLAGIARRKSYQDTHSVDHSITYSNRASFVILPTETSSL